MILKQVNSPQDIKKLNIKDLTILAHEIRELIIKVVLKNGGHLASSLGAVECCLALHYCLDSPRDTIIFDVGHQTYAHKIITGRGNLFYKLRKKDGLSGFPDPAESIYDVYISGHASTAISWAQGISEAKKLKGDSSKTVAVVGDGSLTGGMCFEGLNNCGHIESDVLVIVNHNEMSISSSVGALSNYLTKIISAPIYNRIKNELEQFIMHFAFMKYLTKKAKKFEEAIKSLIVPGVFFEELGFRYFGPIDGHNLGVLIPTINNLLKIKGPRILHILTRKGKGYPPAEDNPEKFHSVSPGYSIVEQKNISKPANYSEIFGKKLVSLAKNNKNIIAITAAMPTGTGLQFMRQQFPKRFYDVGIAEAHAVGFASGLAKAGLKPVVAIYSTFLQRAFDQIIHDVALQNLGVIFVLDRAGLVGEDGPTHHGCFDISYLRLIPNFVCLAPKSKEELEAALEFALRLNCPVSIRFPKAEAFSFPCGEKIRLGKGEILRRGKEVAIIALGSMVEIALEVVEILTQEGIDPFLINPRFIKPLDSLLLEEIARSCKYIITLEEGTIVGGFGSGVKEFYEQKELLNKLNFLSLGLKDEFIPAGSRKELLKMQGLDAASIAWRIKTFTRRQFTPYRMSAGIS